MKNNQDIYNMKLNEVITIRNEADETSAVNVLRVPGGWIYSHTSHGMPMGSAFVQFDNEFQKMSELDFYPSPSVMVCGTMENGIVSDNYKIATIDQNLITITVPKDGEGVLELKLRNNSNIALNQNVFVNDRTKGDPLTVMANSHTTLTKRLLDLRAGDKLQFYQTDAIKIKSFVFTL